MELLRDVTALGQPPSMESCTRDVYEDKNQQLSEHQSRTIVKGMWEILTQLHSLHVFHGDFYGHNILISRDLSKEDAFEVKLSDFGAAFVCDGEVAIAMERIELRAYGHLVSEIRHLLYRSKPSSEMLDKLQELSESCLMSNNEATPASFASVEHLVKEC